MFAIRGAFSRISVSASANSSSALLLAAPQRATFASSTKSSKTKLSWRQKQKLEERKRNPQTATPRQPPRAKVERRNFLVSPPVDDGKKWRVLSAGILERLPIIQPDLQPYEEDFEMMEHEIALRADQRLDDDFWFMEPGARHITPEEAPLPNAQQDPEELIGAGFQFAPRETEDDATNNRKSLNRALKGRVFLLVKSSDADAKFEWFFPTGEALADEKMRDAAVRHVAAAIGDDLEVTPVGFAPIGYVQYLHDDADTSGFDGTKVFLYKSQHLVGDVQLNSAHAADYLWVTREELAEYLDADVAEYVQKIVPN